MSSLELRSVGRIAAILAVTLGLTACFRPLYGPTASGEDLAATLSAIDVEEVAVPPNGERFAHYLRSELVYELNGSGIPSPKRYKLALSFGSSLSTPIVDTATGRAQSATINGTVTYALKSLDGSKTITGGCSATHSSGSGPETPTNLTYHQAILAGGSTTIGFQAGHGAACT